MLNHINDTSLNFKYGICLCVFLIVLGCEKDITVNMPKIDKMAVVDGYIENGKSPILSLSRSEDYFTKVDSNTAYNMLILNAEISIEELESGFESWFTLELNDNIFPFLFYRSESIKGKTGKTYELRVKSGKMRYAATTSIPAIVPIDSMNFLPQQPYDDAGYVWFYFTDPPEQGNYYRMFSKKLGADSIFVHPYSSVISDKLFNGQSMEYPIYRGGSSVFVSRDTTTRTTIDEEDSIPDYFYSVGDTVVVKLCSIDKEHYQFWLNIERQGSAAGNPFSSPANIPTNMSEGGLGFFGGYAAYYDTIVCSLPETK